MKDFFYSGRNSVILDRLANLLALIKKRWQWIGRLVTIGAIVYALGLLAYSWKHLTVVDWTAYIVVGPTVLGLYLVSVLLQLSVWLSILAPHHKISWYDTVVYTRSILLRQLPGGVWQWAGRITFYETHQDVSSKVIMQGSFLEWCLLIANAFGAYGAWNHSLSTIPRFSLIGISLFLSIILAYLWQPHSSVFKIIVNGFIWMICYLTSWTMGGLILYLLVFATNGAVEATVAQINAIWAIAGGISAISIITPSGLGIRELTLTYFLGPFLPVPLAILVALLIRFIFTLADIVWGITGWYISQRLYSKSLKAY